jgi:dolichol-phosphate mannosyltransferase
LISEAGLGIQRTLRLGLESHGKRVACFAVVGASGVLVNNAILWFLVEWLRLSPPLAAVVATEAAIVSNFLLNDRWTFRDLRGSRPWAARLASYNVLTLGGLVISVAVLTVLHYWAGVHYLVANLVGIAAGMAWNYGTNRYWTWSRLEARRLPFAPRARRSDRR